eukprot:tig00000396_g24906.t1
MPASAAKPSLAGRRANLALESRARFAATSCAPVRATSRAGPRPGRLDTLPCATVVFTVSSPETASALAPFSG